METQQEIAHLWWTWLIVCEHLERHGEHGVARVLCLKLLDGGGIRRELSPDGVYPKGVG